MTGTMNPARFRELSDSNKLDELRRMGLSVTDILTDAYARMYNGVEADRDGKAPPNQECPAHTTTNTANASSSRVPFFPRQFFVPKYAKVSGVIMQCLGYLDYKPIEFYEQKPDEEDLSEWLRPLWYFAWNLSSVLHNWDLPHAINANHWDVRAELNLSARGPLAKDELAVSVLESFYDDWDIEVKLGEYEGEYWSEDEDNGPFELNAGSASGNEAPPDSPAATEERHRALLAEVDIFSFAVQERLNEWYRTFPKPAAEDAVWPSDFTEKEQWLMKNFVREVLGEANPWGSDVAHDDRLKAFNSIKKHKDFPDIVPHAKSLRTIVDICAEVFEHKHTERVESMITYTVRHVG